jgi:putative ABC transport system ATP-binding protein
MTAIRSAEGPMILCEGLIRIFTVASADVVALSGLDLRVAPGELAAIVGVSGSGKSTLMNILGGLDTPTAGRAVVAGRDLVRMGEADRATYRRQTVGFVWQQAERNLLPYLTAEENAELPMLLDGVRGGTRAARARELLDLVGVEPARRRLPTARLSGGEQQRVAVAVALSNRPPVLLADEPTGELDTVSAGELFDALRRVNHELGTTILLVTHDPLVATQVGRTIAIRDGRTSTETLRRTDGATDHAGEEFVVLDSAGRMQLPRAHIEALGLAHRVRLRLEEDHVGVWPDGAPARPTDAPARLTEVASPPEAPATNPPADATPPTTAADEADRG